KDDEELAAYQTQMALEDASLHVNASAPGISGTALQSLVQDYRSVQSQIRRLSRQYPQDVLESLLNLPPLTVESLQQEAVVREWIEQLERLVKESSKAGATYSFVVRFEAEEQ